MIWIVITAGKLKVGKAAAVVEAFASAALGTGQADPTPEVIESVSHRIRGEIQSSGKYQVSATENAIPPSLKSLAIRLILWDLQSRLNTIGGTFEPNEQEKTDHRDDLRYLERIARGEVTIEIPADPIATPEVQSGAPTIQAISDRPRQTSRSSLSRL